MGTPYLGEIRAISFNYAPRGWALCNGQLLAISQNQALFSVMGTTYGGNGQTTFALPNLQGRMPLHFGTGYVIGQVGGEAAHTLILPELAVHTHVLQGSSAPGSALSPAGNVLAPAKEGGNLYSNAGANVNLSSTSVTPQGGSQPHPNMPPYLVINFVIALQGIFPSRN